MTAEQKSYEADYGYCGTCHCRRPERELETVVTQREGQPETKSHRCKDQTWCVKVIAERMARDMVTSEKK